MRLIDADIFLSKIEPDEYYHTNEIMDMVTDILSEGNALLTLEELRGMDGEPVWVEFPKCPEASGWMLISAGRHCVYDGLLGDCDFDNYGKTWLAYRRSLEEGNK